MFQPSRFCLNALLHAQEANARAMFEQRANAWLMFQNAVSVVWRDESDPQAPEVANRVSSGLKMLKRQSSIKLKVASEMLSITMPPILQALSTDVIGDPQPQQISLGGLSSTACDVIVESLLYNGQFMHKNYEVRYAGEICAFAIRYNHKALAVGGECRKFGSECWRISVREHSETKRKYEH